MAEVAGRGRRPVPARKRQRPRPAGTLLELGVSTKDRWFRTPPHGTVHNAAISRVWKSCGAVLLVLGSSRSSKQAANRFQRGPPGCVRHSRGRIDPTRIRQAFLSQASESEVRFAWFPLQPRVCLPHAPRMVSEVEVAAIRAAQSSERPVSIENARLVPCDAGQRPGAGGHRETKALCFALLSLACALGITATACAPIPCPSGYLDPDWCLRKVPGGGGGSGG
jgi:hypothetical protein